MNLERSSIQHLNFSDGSVKASFVRKIQLLDGTYRIEMSKVKRRRSNEQNAYLWGIVYPAVSDALYEAWGERLTTDEVHIMMKGMFLSRPIVNRQTGEEISKVWPSSATLNIQQFSEYIEQISKFVAQSFGVCIPEAAPK